MREIEKNMVKAINSKKDFSQSNTIVHWNDNECNVYLWGNRICHIDKNGNRTYSHCNWHTPTTRSRLNALGCNCHIKDGVMVMCDTELPMVNNIVTHW
jgi:hypothetical protein